MHVLVASCNILQGLVAYKFLFSKFMKCFLFHVVLVITDAKKKTKCLFFNINIIKYKAELAICLPSTLKDNKNSLLVHFHFPEITFYEIFCRLFM